MIDRIDLYRFDNKEFRNLDEVAKYVENELGKLIDATPNRLAPRVRLEIYKALVVNRQRVCKLLSAEYLVDQDALQPEIRSIFQL